jgi:hypothetical protein
VTSETGQAVDLGDQQGSPSRRNSKHCLSAGRPLLMPERFSSKFGAFLALFLSRFRPT